jgi:hypothetical protein
MGRPSDYTPEMADLICKRLADGESLRSICRDENMPAESTVRAWALDDREGFYAQYARSRDIALDSIAEEVFEIADGLTNDPARDRLRFDARRWYLSKLAPKKYGDKQTIDQTVTVRHEDAIDSLE